MTAEFAPRQAGVVAGDALIDLTPAALQHLLQRARHAQDAGLAAPDLGGTFMPAINADHVALPRIPDPDPPPPTALWPRRNYSPREVGRRSPFAG